ncbi:hypothetical protein CBS101457_006337 [Exobasidium rhododendri]|nr:hypothetical protein CBS101457_006337 [Exobasidium rhododendri]
MTAVLPTGDYTAPSTKRVSYILPLVRHAPRLFQLPTLKANADSVRGRSGPLLLSSGFDIPLSSSLGQSREGNEYGAHPRHCLPVSSLALDTSTILGGTQDGKPRGILYTGGRDGMIVSWELGLRMKRRRLSNRNYTAEENDEEDDEDEESAAGFLDEQSTMRSDNRSHRELNQNQWEVDDESDKGAPTPATKFRQCIGSHTDWINDIVLCNQNQTVISASSDRSVKIWNPHDSNSSLTPQMLGMHNDYVKALAYAPRANWVASGSFDKTIKVWDIQEMRTSPVVTIADPHLRTSIYGLSVNARGNIIAAASSEKTIQIFDPRSGHQISQLVGHTDNVRSVVLSQDGRHLLSASSDSTIRLWSLAEQRCLHTFTHHNDSVWSLFSNHESLDVFYSGDRSGIVCKVDWARCNEVSEGECVVLAKEKRVDGDAKFERGSIQDSRAAGIFKILAADNAYFWTANSSSEVNRWKDVSPRSEREALYPIRSVVNTTPSQSRAVSSSNRPSALKGYQSGGSTTTIPTAVSFADHTTSLPSTSFESPYNSSKMNDVDTDTPPASTTMYGLPFDSLVCLAPPNDLYGESIGLGSISMRGKERKDSVANQFDTMFSSASLISIPSVVRAATSSTHRDSLGGYSPATVDGLGLAASSPVNAHIVNAQSKRPDSTRPSSARSTNLRFAPVVDHSSSSNLNHAQGNDEGEDHAPADAANEMREDDDNNSSLEARQAFEERDSATDATPLRNAPQDTIHGSHGLIRSSMLNDRRHVLTIDSAGHIFLWDIISAQCLGAFDWYEVVETWSQLKQLSPQQAKDAHLLPGEALEIVKERIQGEGTTPMWCTIDTKIGALSVHFDFPRCFDAEIYVDELESVMQSSEGNNFTYKEDQRVNVAKLILRSLFHGFIQREAKLRSGGEAARLKKRVLAIEMPETLMNRPDLKLELGREKKRSDVSHAQAIRTPGMTIALAIPAKTPAILSSSSPLTPKSGMEMPALQQMLYRDQSTNGGTTAQSVDGQSGIAGNLDYFSLQKSMGGDKAQTPLAKAGTPLAGSGANGAILTSPGSPGSGLMGRLRMSMKRGDQKREEKGIITPQPMGLGHLHDVEESQAERGASTETKQYLEDIRQVMMRADPSKVMEEMPLLRFPLETAITISETTIPDSNVLSSSSSTIMSTWQHVDYRGLVKSTENDVPTLEILAPTWLLEFLVGASDDNPPVKEKDKLTFLLIPWEPPTTATTANGHEGAESATTPTAAIPTSSPPSNASLIIEKMPAMPTGNSRLTATKMLRIKKACSYVAEKLDIIKDGNVSTKSRANSIIASRRGSVANLAETGSSSTPSATNNALSMTSKKLSTLKNNNTSSETLNKEQSGEVEGFEIIEILCNGILIPPHCTLSHVQRFYWRSSSPIKLEYRYRADA